MTNFYTARYYQTHGRRLTDWLTLFAQVDNTETKLDWKLQCAGQQVVKLTNSWPRDKYKLKLQIKQYKLKYTYYKLLNSKEFIKINVTEFLGSQCLAEPRKVKETEINATVWVYTLYTVREGLYFI